MWACERFRAYLYGPEFELMTGYKPLECFFSPKSKTCARIERWLLRMQPYKFSVKYIPSPKNIVDSLSRLLHPTSNLKETSQTDEYVKWVAQESTRMAARRGTPEMMISGNGTNFTSAERELRNLVPTLDQTRIDPGTPGLPSHQKPIFDLICGIMIVRYYFGQC